MRIARLLALILFFVGSNVRADSLLWFVPDHPGMVPAVIELASAPDANTQLSGLLRAHGFAYAVWDTLADDADWFKRIKAAEPIDRSRVALLASGRKVDVALKMLSDRDARSLGLQALVLRVDGETDSKAAMAASLRVHALLVTYTASDAAAREIAAVLARRARAVGTKVWLRPQADQDEADLVAWLAALDVPRASRFEDLVIDAYRGPNSQEWVRVLEQRALGNAHDVSASGLQVEHAPVDHLMLDDDGRIVYADATGMLSEFAGREALAAVFGDDGLVLEQDAAGAQWMIHPETGARSFAFAVSATAHGKRHALLLLRDEDGSHALIDLHDSRRVVAMAADEGADSRGRVWWLLMDAKDANEGRLLRLTLPGDEPHRGLWWDPSHPGHALDLQPIAGGHSAIFASFDDQGDSRWQLATGRIRNGRFVAEYGLQLMRRSPAIAAPKADSRFTADLIVDFNVDARHPVCARRKAVATQLALLSISSPGGALTWCIEPVALPAGVPDADVNGTWFGGANDSGWGMTLVAAGPTRSPLVSAMLYFHDQEGWPRWAMGAGQADAKGAALTMNSYRLRCVDCPDVGLSAEPLGILHTRFGGWCGAPELRAAFELDQTADRRFMRAESSLQRVTEARCR